MVYSSRHGAVYARHSGLWSKQWKRVQTIREKTYPIC